MGLRRCVNRIHPYRTQPAAAPWHPDENCNEALASADVTATRLTRRFTYEGAAVISRTVSRPVPAGKRVFLECERARRLSLRINGQDVPHFTEPSISTPQVFEITDRLTGSNEITLISDNSYPGWPREDIVYPLFASFPTDTHTDWQWWPMAKLLECRCSGGRLLISSIGLHSLMQYPEARALQQAIYDYPRGDHALPEQELTAEEVRVLVK